MTTDWGVPDWRDAAAYPNVTDWHLVRWRWEATRRLRDYRKDAMEFLENIQTGWDGEEQQEAWEAYWHKWGFNNQVLDPRQTNYSDQELMWSGQKGGGVSIRRGSSIEGAVLEHVVHLRNQDFVVHFDLDKPFEQQLQSAKKAFEKEQIKRHGKKRGPTPGVNGISATKQFTWLKYLRVIDAQNFGASPYEIADVLGLVPESHLGHDRHQKFADAGKSVKKAAMEWSRNITEISHPPKE